MGAWYAEHLGVRLENFGGAVFIWDADPTPSKSTVWSIFPADSDCFAPGEATFMINFRVADLDRMLAQLAAGGVATVGDVADLPYGRFAWVLDPEGNKVEIWQPPETMPE